MSTSLDFRGKLPSVQYNTIARTDTAAKTLFILPKGSIPIAIEIFSGTASDASTSAVVSVGKTGSNTFFLNTWDVKTAATGTGVQFPTGAKVTNLFASVGIADITVVGIYAEAGTASTTGGAWTVAIWYLDP